MNREDACCVKGCSGLLTTTHLHKFPKDPLIRKKWLDELNLEYLTKLPPHLLQNKVVCQKHFKNKFISKKLCKVLKRTAVPSIFPDAANDNQIEHSDSDEATFELQFLDTITRPMEELPSDFHENIKNVKHTYRRKSKPTLLHSRPQNLNVIRDNVQKRKDLHTENINLIDVPANTDESDAVTQFDGTTHTLHAEEETCSLVNITVSNKVLAKQVAKALLQIDMAASVDFIYETMFKDGDGNIQQENKIVIMAKSQTSKVPTLCEFVATNYPLASYQVLSVSGNDGNTCHVSPEQTESL